ncbi:MAG: hypothetical protein KF775_18525 [Cyclobacteriaceae bacterium]|nr:hypothetical protein [Cyclobacteriaceae bacterium]
MSTAFEDFELNTAENTRLLFEQNVFVGETLKAHQAGAFKWNKILFPVLVDKPIHQPDLSDSRTIETIIQHNEGWLAGPEPEKQKIRTALKGYFAQQIQCGYTFAVNLMQGTPTFILFDNTMSILLNWFGHQDPQLVTDKIDTFIKKS